MAAARKLRTPDPEALVGVLLDQLKNTSAWYRVYEKTLVNDLRRNGVVDEVIADALGIARTTVTRRYGPVPD